MYLCHRSHQARSGYAVAAADGCIHAGRYEHVMAGPCHLTVAARAWEGPVRVLVRFLCPSSGRAGHGARRVSAGPSPPDGGLLDLGEEAEQLALLAGGERCGDQLAFACVQRWQELVDDQLGVRGDVDEELAPVAGVRQAPDEAALLEGVEQGGHAARRDEQALGNYRRLQRLADTVDDGKDLPGAGGELVLLAGLPVVQFHRHGGGPVKVRVALGGERAGAGVLVLEVVADPDQRLRCARGAARAVPRLARRPPGSVRPGPGRHRARPPPL